jgi:tRNA dimethylallyltransferase
LILTGPTGSGKSGWAERLAAEYPLEIISVDSAQVYRGMDIGTAKPSRAVRARIPHHLIDILEPTGTYSVGQFVQDCTRLIGEIRSRGHIPLLVGGTMLYLRGLLRGIAPLPQGSASLRQQIDDDARRLGWPALHEQLRQLDPAAAARIHPNDAQRIQRALEVCRLTGRSLSQLHSETTAALREPVSAWALVPEDRAVLHQRIADRFADMMQAGFLDEVRALYARGDLTAEHPAMRTVGYRQLWSHLAGEYTLSEAVQSGIAATRQLAKRQLTWLRSEPSITIVNSQPIDSYDIWRGIISTTLKRF